MNKIDVDVTRKSNVSMNAIGGTDLRGVDLNLLVAFEALMRTRSVTKAARALRIGQPAASYALRRLRDLFDDPLFVRAPDGIAPTARALELAGPVRSALGQLERVLFASAAFEPRREARGFRIGATDYVQAVALKPLLDRLLAEAPHCRLIASPTNCDTVARELERGEIDLAIGVFPRGVSTPHRRVLFEEGYACVFDREACAVAAPLSRDDWLSLPHVMMSTRADFAGPLDEALDSAGERRFVVASTPSFLTIPYWLKGARAVATMPARLAEFCARSGGLTVSPLPFAAPSFEVVMRWHSRADREPGAAWLRETIADAVARANDSAGSASA